MRLRARAGMHFRQLHSTGPPRRLSPALDATRMKCLGRRKDVFQVLQSLLGLLRGKLYILKNKMVINATPEIKDAVIIHQGRNLKLCFVAEYQAPLSFSIYV